MLVATDLFRQGRIGRTEDQPRLVSFQPQPSIARGILADLDRHVPGNVVLRELLERLDDLGRRDPRRASIPDRKRRDPVGVDVLRRLDQFCEPGQPVPRGFVVRTVHFDQHGMVALDDQRILGTVSHHQETSSISI